MAGAPRADGAEPWTWAVALAAVVVAAVALMLALARPQFMGVDDALYMTIGTNMLAGRGTVDAFGGFPGVHAPLWPLIVVAPQFLVGIDPATTAHVLVVASAAATVALVAYLAGRALPAAAPLAAAAMLTFGYFLKLGTGLGLDLPVAALTLLYVAVGLAAARLGSLRLGIAAGLLFAVAFTIKETVLPFAPAPVFAGLVAGWETRRVLRPTGAAILALLAGTSWWWVIYAQHTGTVYRLGTPAWTLLPLAILALAVALAFLGAGAGRLAGLPVARGLTRRRKIAAGWVAALAWCAVLTIYFARAAGGSAASDLSLEQVANNVRTWAPYLRPMLAVGAIGGVLAVADRIALARRGADRSDRVALPPPPPADGAAPAPPFRGRLEPSVAAIDAILVAILCGAPLIPLVISVGEGPRHYIAVIGLAVGLGAIGWTRLAVRLLDPDPRTAAIAAVAAAAAVLLYAPRSPLWLLRTLSAHPALVVAGAVAVAVAVLVVVAARRSRATPGRSLATIARRVPRGALVGAGVALVAGSVLVGAVEVQRAQETDDPALARSRTAVADWVRANEPAGAVIAFGRIGAFETALLLQLDYRVVLVRDDSGIRVDPTAPLGVRLPGQPGTASWFALRAAPTNVTTLYGYEATTTANALRAAGATIWIQTEITGTRNISPVVDALGASSGVTPVAHWSWPYGSGRLETTIYRVDLASLAFTQRVYVTQAGLARIVAGLERSPAQAAPAAAALLDRAVLVPAGTAVPDLLDRLRRLADR